LSSKLELIMNCAGYGSLGGSSWSHCASRTKVNGKGVEE
jgi:hypothetical protein